MDKHDDLMAAALNAVEAVESHNSDDNSQATSTDKTDCSPADKNVESVDVALESNTTSKNAEGNEDYADIHFSLSAFGEFFDDEDDSSDDGTSSDIVLNSLDDALSKPQSNSNEQLNELQNKLDNNKEELEAARQKNKDLQTEIDQLRMIQKQLNDRLVRVSADFDNYRKRVIRDQELSKNQAEERIVNGFLPVMDNLERALAHAKQSDDYQQLLQGVEMTAKLYLAALAKHGCVPYDSLGNSFDPVYHDVLQRVIDPEKEHNSIVQEHLKGYMMHDRVLRPALVVVAQHEESTNEGEN